jgi:hypothetical protein
MYIVLTTPMREQIFHPRRTWSRRDRRVVVRTWIERGQVHVPFSVDRICQSPHRLANVDKGQGRDKREYRTVQAPADDRRDQGANKKRQDARRQPRQQPIARMRTPITCETRPPSHKRINVNSRAQQSSLSHWFPLGLPFTAFRSAWPPVLSPSIT